jgi:hypothetical protein
VEQNNYLRLRHDDVVFVHDVTNTPNSWLRTPKEMSKLLPDSLPTVGSTFFIEMLSNDLIDVPGTDG